VETQLTPTWQVTNLDDAHRVERADYQGKPTLAIFFNIGCHGCMARGLPVAQNIKEQYPEINVVGIHSSFGAIGRDPEQVKAELKPYDLSFPILLDDGHVTYDAYQADGTPHWILLDENGQVQKSIFGSMPNALQRLEYSLIELFEH